MPLFRRRRSAVWRAIKRLEGSLMSEQEQVNTLETTVAKVATDLTSAKTALQAELDELQTKINEGQPVSLTKLTEAVSALDPAVEALSALKPAA